MNQILQSELWEIQAILYWILAALLFKVDHSWLAWAATGYGTFTFVAGVLKKLATEDKEK